MHSQSSKSNKRVAVGESEALTIHQEAAYAEKQSDKERRQKTNK